MSTEMHVLFRGKLPDRKTLSRELAELGFPFRIAASVGSLEKQNGFLPMWLRRDETGVEFDVFEGREAVEELVGKDLAPRFERTANFRWGGDENEALAGVCTAAALAKLVNGMVLEESENELLTADQAIALARQGLKEILKPEDKPQRGTRPANLKRYLKPLLKQRSDLVLIGRMLLVRPVRHLLRGAYLDGRDKYQLRVFSYLNLLCDPYQLTRVAGIIRPNDLYVWQPDFEPLLLDVLRSETFEQIRGVEGIDDFAPLVPDENWYRPVRATALLLAGSRERAEEYFQAVESEDPTNPGYAPWYRRQRELFAMKTEDICALYHAKEAETVKAMKLDGIWEPSPFPIEIPAAERKQRSDETPFVPVPWVASPDRLLGDVPDLPGDIRFAKDWRPREPHPVLVAPLSREDAEERHREGEPYVVAARQPGNIVVVLECDGIDRRDSRRELYSHLTPDRHRGHLWLALYGSDVVAHATFFGNYPNVGIFSFWDVWVRERSSSRVVWNVNLVGARERTVYDQRGHQPIRTKTPLTPAESDRLHFPSPAFGDFEGLVQMALSTLRESGYGEIT